MGISIHTTLAGGDLFKSLSKLNDSISIHTTLAGGDSRISGTADFHRPFQSTPPSRVATWGLVQLLSWTTNFNPHHPRGWRRPLRGFLLDLSGISIHTTLAGGDYSATMMEKYKDNISIHTTLAGGDGRVYSPGENCIYFNPHHPRGWRQLMLTECWRPLNFNPHHPRGWRP